MAEVAQPSDEATEQAGPGVRVDQADPLAVLAYGQSEGRGQAGARAADPAIEANERIVRAPLQGTVVSIAVEPGAAVPTGGEIAVMEAMKMEHRMTTPVAGEVVAVHAVSGEQISSGAILLEIQEQE